MSTNQRRALRVLAVMGLALGTTVLVTGASASGHEGGEAETDVMVDACAEWTPTPEEIAQANAESDELAAYLEGRGIAHRVETDDFGFRYVEWDYDDPAVNEAVDDFYWAKYPIPAEELAMWNAETDDLAAHLQANGVAVTLTTDRHGIRILEWDYEDEHAVNVVDDYYWAKYPIPAEEIAAINAESDELAAFLESQGIAHTVSEDRHGIRFVEWDYEDPAVTAAVDEFYATKYPVEEMTEPACG